MSENTYCAFCGKTNLIKSSVETYTNYYVTKGKAMNYSKIETNESGTPLECPKCQNTVLDDNFNYCPICSTYVHNVCLGGDNNRYFDDEGEYKKSINERYESNQQCAGYLDGSYRFCPDCGSETSFYEQKLLISWNEEQKQFNSDADPFSVRTTFNSKEDQLPF